MHARSKGRPQRSSYRQAERLRQASWIVNHSYDYADREIAGAKEIVRNVERSKNAAEPRREGR